MSIWSQYLQLSFVCCSTIVHFLSKDWAGGNHPMGSLLEQNKVTVFSLSVKSIHRWVCKRLETVFNSPESGFPLVSDTVSSPAITHELSAFGWQQQCPSRRYFSGWSWPWRRHGSHTGWIAWKKSLGLQQARYVSNKSVAPWMSGGALTYLKITWEWGIPFSGHV